ncbi:MAG: hypothetical protein EHM21_14265 [Chloroflexi bacterium]|nr:MAG: hypothetical protein EHM21_14265 [Chloroflexota bacterium]
MAVLWLVFGAAYFTHPQAWTGADLVEPQTGWAVFAWILTSNCLLTLLIVGGNLFVRFGSVTPGLVVLALQAVIIGWTAGTNGFLEPFPSVEAANATFLRVGLWETSAYALLCAVTMPKSMLVAATFPAKEWVETHSLKNLRFTRLEVTIAAVGGLCLLGAAVVEAFFPGV